MAEETEAEFTAKALMTEDVPDVFEATYFMLLLWEIYADFTGEVAAIIGAETLKARLEYKMNLWIPCVLEGLRTDWSAVDSWIDMLLAVKEQFPKSIGSTYSLQELALIRRQAHIREGKDAVVYLKTQLTQLRQPSLLTLSGALLAGVSKSQLGNPPLDMCTTALKEQMPDAVEEGRPWTESVRSSRQAGLDFVRELNQQLNPLLPKKLEHA